MLRILQGYDWKLHIRGLHGRIFQSRPGLARIATIYLARSEVKKKVWARARPGLKEKLKFEPGPGPARPETDIKI